MFIDQIISGLVAGSAYSLLAIGYSLIFASMRLLHFAQGDFLMLGGFIALSLVTAGIGNSFINVILVMVVFVFVGHLVERFCYRRIPYHMHSPRIIATLGIGMALRNLASVLWGARAQTLPGDFFSGPVLVLGSIKLQPAYYWTLIIAAVLMTLLAVFLNKTKAGLAIRAAAFNADVAEIMGINAAMSRAISFIIGSCLAGCAGVLVAPLTFIHYEMGVSLGMKGFSAAVLGGLGSIPGAMVGGLLLGIIETLGATAISSGYKDSIAFIVLILILVFRPSGLLGQSEPEKI
ncbi:MAG: branched-chain amino acid transport system permease protein [Clostridia bacterium]|nr:branched-chain amino acid transport system permease protein [Clostridia bacterium]